MKNYTGTINGVEHTIQANSVDEAKRFVSDPKEVKAAKAPENKSATPADNK